MVEGMLLRKNRIVIPVSMRQDMLRRIHEGHLGIEKCKRRARQAVFWPGINVHIEKYLSQCDVCLNHHYKQAKEPMMIAAHPTEPWEKVGTDLFQLNGKDYLVVIDYYSNYPEVEQLHYTTSNYVIQCMKSIFARHGIPHIVQSDNGPQYTSREFQLFAEQYGFKHTTSSPLYPKANGKAEKGVQIVKRLLKKAAASSSDANLSLLSYRSSPLSCGLSPGELLMNRKLRDTLPKLSLKTENNSLSLKKMQHFKEKQKEYYDKGARHLKSLSERDTVRIEEPTG